MVAVNQSTPQRPFRAGRPPTAPSFFFPPLPPTFFWLSRSAPSRAMKLPEGPPRGSELNHARDLLATLSDAIPAVRSLRGHWSAVATTVSLLRATVDDLADLPAASHHNPLVTDLLRSLAETLTPALDLARRCAAAVDPPEGKLRAQSDLAAAAATLDCLAADADLLLRSGALLEPPPATTGGLAAATAESLVTRLQLRSEPARTAALDSLLRLLEVDDKNAVVAAAHGAAPALARLIGSPSQEKALEALARLASVEGCRPDLSSEGPTLLARLARVVDCGGGAGPAAERACAALHPLMTTRDLALVFGSRGGVASLLGLCHAGTPSARAAAAGVLENLSLFRELHQSFLEEGAIPTIMTLLTSGTTQAQQNALSCLRNLAATDVLDTKLAILQQGILGFLHNYSESEDLNQNLKPALGLLKNLASVKYIAEIILAAGFMPLVTAALADKSSGTRIEAAHVIAELTSIPKARRAAGNAGAVYRLIDMLEAKAVEEKGAAVKALASLMHCNKYRRMFKKEERGVMSVVQLLNPVVKNVEKWYAVAVLQAVVQSRQCRKWMVVAGACGYLQWLVESEVEGAKKLLENLGRGKLWGMLGRSLRI